MNIYLYVYCKYQIYFECITLRYLKYKVKTKRGVGIPEIY